MKKLVSSLWFLLIILLVLFASEMPLPVLIGLLVLAFAFPMSREFRRKSDYDERQIVMNRFSSHIAFYLFTGLVLMVMIKKYLAQGKPLDTDPEFYMLLLVPLTVKMLVNVFLTFDPRKAGAFICYLFGGFWLIFCLCETGISWDFIMHSFPFILLVFAGIAAQKLPLISGIVMVILGLAGLVVGVVMNNPNFYVKVIMFTILAFPLLLGGSALIWTKFPKEKGNSI
jgi:hypothetical protein